MLLDTTAAEVAGPPPGGGAGRCRSAGHAVPESHGGRRRPVRTRAARAWTAGTAQGTDPAPTDPAPGEAAEGPDQPEDGAPRVPEAGEPDRAPSWAERIWLGFLGGAGYRRLGAHPRGTYAAFLAVSLATSVALATASGVVASRALDALLAAWAKLPPFTVTGTRLELPPGVVPPVRASAGGAVIVVTDRLPAAFDPLGGAPVGLLLTLQGVVIRSGDTGERALPLTAFGVPLTKATLGAVLRELAGPGLWLAAVLSIAYQLARDFVRAAVIAWFGFSVARMRGQRPTWPQAWRVGLAAWTLPLFAEVGRVWIPYPSWALWVVACVYAVVGCHHQGGEPGPRGAYG